MGKSSNVNFILDVVKLLGIRINVYYFQMYVEVFMVNSHNVIKHTHTHTHTHIYVFRDGLQVKCKMLTVV